MVSTYTPPSTYCHHGTSVLRYSRKPNTMAVPIAAPTSVPAPPSTTINRESTLPDTGEALPEWRAHQHVHKRHRDREEGKHEIEEGDLVTKVETEIWPAAHI